MHLFRKDLLAIVVAALGPLTLQCAATAQCNPEEIAKLLASDGAPGNFFGVSIAISGDAAIIGAVGNDDRGVNSGTAYVFERSNGVWSQAIRLIAADQSAGDYFGWSVAISGDVAIVGSYYDDDLGADSGSAYVFEKLNGQWTQTAKLTASDGAASDWFGYSLSVSGDIVVVGAWGDDDRGDRAGSAYVFEKVADVWTQTAKLNAADAAAGDLFGHAVSISGTRIVIGADGENAGGAGAGAAYVFEKNANAWPQTAKLTADDPAANKAFGYSVSIDDRRALIGADGDNYNGDYTGSAYIFELVGGNWTQTAKLTADDGAASDYFGVSTALDADTVVIGAFGDSDLGNLSGSAYVFQRVGNSWAQAAKLLASDGEAGDWFGVAASIDNGAAFVGARYDNDLGADSGSVYVFDLNCGPQLVSVGNCPGHMRFVVQGATSRGNVAFIYARGLGQQRIPNGFACAGTQLGLDATAQLADVIHADVNGTATLDIPNVPNAACGHIYVQALDIAPCTTTNVIPIQ